MAACPACGKARLVHSEHREGWMIVSDYLCPECGYDFSEIR